MLRFADLRGQERPIAFLRRAWESGRLAHAYLFTGPAGVGKLAAAQALALGLHCERTPFDACGTCRSCVTIAAGTHPDVRVVRGPLKERRDLSIEQVRELQRELGYRSMSAGPKVGVVNDAELLTVQAQNALLKLLEEPGGDTLLVLVSVNASSLVPTILSRCQRVAFDALPTDAVAEVLVRHGRSRAEADALAAFAEGSPGRALSMDPAFFAGRRREILGHMAHLRGADFGRVLAIAQELAGDVAEQGAALAVVASWYRDALRAELLGPDAPLQNADLAADLPRAGTPTTLRHLETTYGTMLALRQNANRNLALVRMLLDLRQ